MSFVIADRVKEASTTVGHGPLTLNGAVAGHVRFSAACAIGDTLYYGVEAVDANGVPTGQWECGLGTYSALNTLTLTTTTASSTGGAVSFAAGTKHVFVTLPAAQVKWIRERLTADRTYYVRKDGADTNSGLADTAAGAFLTIQKAVDAAKTFDGNGFRVLVSVAAGTYAEDVSVPWGTVGVFSIDISGASASTCILEGSLQSTATVSVSIAGMKVTGAGISVDGHGTLEVGSDVVFGTCTDAQISVYGGGTIYLSNDYTINGSAPRHIWVVGGGKVFNYGIVTTLSGTPAFSTAFVHAEQTAVVYLTGGTYSGAATGKRYSVTLNSVVISGGATLPGSIAGTTATGGQYS